MAAEPRDEGRWPLEGHFVIGGAWGLQLHTECLGATFTSRTANHDLEIGLPRQAPKPNVPKQFRHLLGPPNLDLTPPKWMFEPANEEERQEENHVSPVWGSGDDSDEDTVVYPPSAKYHALVYRCRFYTTVEASNERDFQTAASAFLGELDDWWNRFTDWVGVVAGQDFIGLGGYMRPGTTAGAIRTWTGDAHGNRIGQGIESRFPPPRYGIPPAKLSLEDMRRCVAVTGRQTPPAEWILIRDARLLLNAGHIRRAVLDAGTAAELAMTALVDEYLADANALEPLRTAIAKGYNNLGAKHALFKLLRPGLLPQQTQPDLIDKRNTASHGGDQITVDEAIEAIQIATTIVDAAHSLDDLLGVTPTPPSTS